MPAVPDCLPSFFLTIVFRGGAEERRTVSLAEFSRSVVELLEQYILAREQGAVDAEEDE